MSALHFCELLPFLQRPPPTSTPTPTNDSAPFTSYLSLLAGHKRVEWQTWRADGTPPQRGEAHSSALILKQQPPPSLALPFLLLSSSIHALLSTPLWPLSTSTLMSHPPPQTISSLIFICCLLFDAIFFGFVLFCSVCLCDCTARRWLVVCSRSL